MIYQDLPASDAILARLRSLTEEAQQSVPLQQLPMAFARINEQTKQLESECFMLHEQLKSINTQLDLADTILRHIRQAIVFVNTQGYITTYNLTAEKLLNIKQKKILNHLYSDFFEDDFFGFSMRRALAKLKAPKIHRITLFTQLYEMRSLIIRRGDPIDFGIMIFMRPHLKLDSQHVL